MFEDYENYIVVNGVVVHIIRIDVLFFEERTFCIIISLEIVLIL